MLNNKTRRNKAIFLSLCITAMGFLLMQHINAQTKKISTKVTDVWVVTKTHFDFFFPRQIGLAKIILL